MKSLKKVVLLLAILSSVSGCAVNRAEVLDQNILANKKVVFVYGLEDPLKIKGSVDEGLTKLGYTVTEQKEKSELIADFKYKCYWDVIHYTCSEINFYLSDPKTKKIVLQSRYWGDNPFGPETLVKDLFKKIESELQEKAVQPTH